MTQSSSGTRFDLFGFRCKLKGTVLRSLPENIGEIAKDYNVFPGSDTEKKATVDQTFKDILKSMVEEDRSTPDLIGLTYLAVKAVQNELCSPSLPFVMLSDVFDTITIEQCEDVFRFVEKNVDIWKSEVFYNAGKNYLLRMCNDLLRRLSKSQHTIFCGRIQLFLARLFPLSEKSGLNLMSQFNLENVTLYTTKSEDYDRARKMSDTDQEVTGDMEEGEMEELANSIPIDYNLYRKFWALQDYFRKPQQCYDKSSWKTFTNYADEVLNCFESFKLDDMKVSRKKKDLSADAQSQPFFAKYLTSEKLLDLQLSDGHFRRFVLVQFLILFQYLHAQVKFKNSSQILAEEQSPWVKQTQEKVYKVLKETPPEGEKFAEAIEHILTREDNWNTWKNEGCPTYVRQKPEKEVKMPTKPTKRSIGEDLKTSGGKLIKMGSAELTHLWNLCPDNIAACKDPKRNFLPQMEEFFEEAIEQNDPDAGIEDEYKLVNNPTYAWTSLRLLSRRSPHFFAPQAGGVTGNQPAKSVAKYLEGMLEKLVKEMPIMYHVLQSANPSESEEKTEVVGDDQDEKSLQEDGLEKEKDPSTPEREPLEELKVTTEQLKMLAEKLSNEWRNLATELTFKDDDIAYIEKENSEAVEQAENMLILWQENEIEKATVGALRLALKEVGLVNIGTEVFGEEEDG